MPIPWIVVRSPRPPRPQGQGMSASIERCALHARHDEALEGPAPMPSGGCAWRTMGPGVAMLWPWGPCPTRSLPTCRTRSVPTTCATSHPASGTHDRTRPWGTDDRIRPCRHAGQPRSRMARPSKPRPGRRGGSAYRMGTGPPRRRGAGVDDIGRRRQWRGTGRGPDHAGGRPTCPGRPRIAAEPPGVLWWRSRRPTVVAGDRDRACLNRRPPGADSDQPRRAATASRGSREGLRVASNSVMRRPICSPRAWVWDNTGLARGRNGPPQHGLVDLVVGDEPRVVHEAPARLDVGARLAGRPAPGQ